MSTEGQFELVEELVRGYRCRVFSRAPRTLPALLEAVPWKSDAIALVYGPLRLSYRELSSTVDRLAHALQSRCAIGVGSRVGLAMRNLPEWGVCVFGARPSRRHPGRDEQSRLG